MQDAPVRGMEKETCVSATEANELVMGVDVNSGGRVKLGTLTASSVTVGGISVIGAATSCVTSTGVGVHTPYDCIMTVQKPPIQSTKTAQIPTRHPSGALKGFWSSFIVPPLLHLTCHQVETGRAVPVEVT